MQCGLCRVTCPEKVIALEPRLNFTNAAMSAVTLNEDEPFECIRCGKPFGVRKSIERIAEQLAGKHSMFRESGQIDRIRMCEDCRSTDQPVMCATDPAYSRKLANGAAGCGVHISFNRESAGAAPAR